MLGDSVMYIAILGVMVLVACNTAVVASLFRHGLKNDTEYGVTFDAEEGKWRERTRASRSWMVWILQLIWVLLCVWVLLSASGTLLSAGQRLFHWRTPSEQQVAHEILAIVLFGIFLLVDCWLLGVINRELKLWASVIAKVPLAVAHGEEARARSKIAAKLDALRSERRFQIDTIWFIDIPVLVGVSTVLLAHVYIHHHQWSILADRDKSAFNAQIELPRHLDLHLNDVELDGRLPVKGTAGAGVTAAAAPTWAEKVSQERQLRRFAGFVQGLATGAVMMHIAISQFILGVLLFRMFVRKPEFVPLSEPGAVIEDRRGASLIGRIVGGLRGLRRPSGVKQGEGTSEPGLDPDETA